MGDNMHSQEIPMKITGSPPDAGFFVPERDQLMTPLEQLARAVAAEFHSHGCSTALLDVDSGIPTLLVGKSGCDIVVCVSPNGELEAGKARRWADTWRGTLLGCSGQAHAAAIADALAGGEFE